PRRPAQAAAAAGLPTVPPQPAPQRQQQQSVICRTSLVHTPLQPHQRRLAELTERLVRAATARLAQGAFPTRELSTLLWSLVALGYWQPPLLPLAAAFLDYGAERLRGADSIAMATVLQVMARAQAAAAAGHASAVRVLDLAPPALAVVASALPPRLPSCDARTLTGLLHSCASLLSCAPASPILSLPQQAQLLPQQQQGQQGQGQGQQASSSSGSGGLAALAREVTRECMRRRFVGFGPKGLISVASALTTLRAVAEAEAAAAAAATASIGTTTGTSSSSSSAVGGDDTSSVPAASLPAATPAAGGVDDAEVWRLLAAAAVAPLAPEMAGASVQQWRMLLKLVETRGAANTHLLAAAAEAAAGGAAAGEGGAAVAEAGVAHGRPPAQLV
ncbi:hypothetical protein Agub_g11873, partial [Astrephomene gubernaculifera]